METEIRNTPTNADFTSGGSNVSVRHLFVNLRFVVRSEFSAKISPERKAGQTLIVSV